jgi:hypothetical protein
MPSRLRVLAIVAALAILVIGGARLRGPGPGPGSLASASPQPVAVTSGGAATLAPPPPSEALSVGVSDVHPTVTPDGSTVLSVRLVAHVHTAVAFDPSTIRFVLTAPGSIGTEGRVTATPLASSPAVEGLTFNLTFDLRGLSAAPAPGEVAFVGGVPPAPGAWLLTLDLRDVAGGMEHASTPVQIVAGA